MQYLEISDSTGGSLRISKLILGGVPFGTAVDAEHSFEILDRFFELGGNAVDTARVYCDWLEGGSGVSEKTIGDWIRSRGCRSRVLLITKGGHPRFSNMDKPRLSKEEILGDMNLSLKTLGTDYVDLYLLHRDDRNRPAGEIVETLDGLVRAGKARSVGVSNWTVERIAEANEYARKNGLAKLCVSEIQWSLAECFPETFGDRTLICMDNPEYRRYLEAGIPVLAYSSQANGIFQKAAKAGGLNRVGEKFQKFNTSENRKRFEKLERYCQKSSLTETDAALGYLTANRLPAAAIIGCRTLEQLNDCMGAADTPMTAEDANLLT